MSRTLVVHFAILSTIFMATAARAQTSKEYALMAKATWSAFECSALADKSRNPKEQERLFRFGYGQGQAFIAALQANKVRKEDLDTHAPFMLLLLLQGPSPDFMLGRIFNEAQERALEDVYKTGNTRNNEEQQSSLAETKFWNQNSLVSG